MAAGDVVQAGVAPSKGGIDCQYATQTGEELLVQLWPSDSPQLVIGSLTGRIKDRQRERKWLDKWRTQHALDIKSSGNSANNTMEPTR